MLPVDEARAVVAAARRRRFDDGDVVFHEHDLGDAMYLIDTGHAAVRVTTPHGDVATIRILGPGDFFGEMALVAPGRRSATIRAVGRLETRTLVKDVLDRLSRDHPSVRELMLRASVAENRRLTAQLADALYLPVPERVERRLVELVDLFGDGDGEVHVPLTQDDIAGLVGSSRATVNRALRGLEDRGVLELARGSLKILDGPALRRRARTSG